MLSLKGKGIGITKSHVRTYAAIQPQGNKLATSKGRLAVETAANAGASTSLSAAGGSNTANQDGFLTGLMTDSGQQLLKIFRDMYHNDAIAGSAVDLQSELPFSEFDLYGVDDKKLDVYQSSVAQLNLRSAAAQMTRHYLVDGAYTSTLVYDKQKKVFRDQVPYALENIKLNFSPLLSQDPVITAKVSSEQRKFLSQTDGAYEKLQRDIPTPLLEALKGGEFELDPLSTIFLARRPFLTNPEPTSYLRRCLPAYLIEKTLYRGTLFEVGRRQRANVHVAAGDDLWEPTPEELSMLANVFQQTDLDPMGAIVVTRNAININEFRQAGDFLKWMDVFDILTTVKMKALGISDAFLSQDSTYSNADNALVIFMENQNAYRDFFTHSVFYNKLFPLIAVINEFFKSTKKQETAASSGNAGLGVRLKEVNDYSQLETPRVRWRKRLTAGNDSNLFESLEKMSEKGIPVPLRLWIAASGVDSDTLLNELKDDARLKKEMDKFGGSSSEKDSDMMTEFSSLRKPRLLAEDFGVLSEAHTEDSQGRRHYAMNQTKAHRKINEMIARSAARLAANETYFRIHRDLVKAGLLNGPARELRAA